LQRHAKDVLDVVAEGARRHGKGLA
jgi:hypothetical protein